MVKYIFFRVRVRDRVRFISNVNYSVFSFPEGQMYDMNGCALADPRNGGPKSFYFSIRTIVVVLKVLISSCHIHRPPNH